MLYYFWSFLPLLTLLLVALSQKKAPSRVLFFNETYRLSDMIYLLCKNDLISVPSYAEGIYHRRSCDNISKIYHP